jgi:hypothetical protein
MPVVVWLASMPEVRLVALKSGALSSSVELLKPFPDWKYPGVGVQPHATEKWEA